MTREEARTALGDRNNLLWGMSKEEQKYYSEALDLAISALSENKGEWIDVSTGKGIFKNRIVKCSVCGNTLDLDGVNCGRGDANYCPNCGADMRPEPYKGE